MENKLAFAKDLIKSSSVPDLTVDLDNTPIDSENFDEYRKLLEVQLPLLFDFIHQNEELLLAKDYNEDVLEIKGRLLMLTTEITAHNTMYKIRNEQFLRVFDEFIEKNFYKILDKEVEEYVLKHYTQYLKADVWKRHIGTVHGFGRFLELKVSNGCKLPIKWVNFSLSVGLTLRECHLPVYKELSTSIFQTIISHSDSKEIKELNIPEVIFEAVLKSVRTVDSVDGTNDIWKCLCDCLDFKDDIDSYEWDMTDEMMENLLGSLKNSSNNDVVICLLSFIPKIINRFTLNRKEIEEFLARDYDSLSGKDFQQFRLECSKINSCAPHRWALYILKLFLAESHKFLGSVTICEKMLQRFHICYLTCLYSISVEIMNINLLKFFEKFSTILMEAIAAQKETPRIRELVQQIYQTFVCHLEASGLEGVLKDFQPYHKAFKQFIDEPF
ncbi:uncharacterized protein LOC129939685 [Eupeodes corollae]|uniref:uncharacterized protein LOC129939685 n=1 Tax=Eupeodes corollae TaxID=290404 RepID=UPI0024924A66|nr:uncharacterized protein LOC129939685 [Eupeodes corollae]